MLRKSRRELFYNLANKLIGLLFILVIFPNFILSLHAERLPVKTYTVTDGLLRDNITKIRQDSHGYLWFCTAEGISRFDGVGMMNFTVADGLPDRSVEDFLETNSGTIYIATGKGLARLNPNGVRSQANSLFTVFLPDNGRAEKILTLYEDKTGKVWVGTSDGLYRLIETGDSVAFEVVPLGEPLKLGRVETETLYITAILADRRGTLWIGTTGSGLFRLSDGYWYVLNLENNQVTATAFGQNGDVPITADFDGDGKSDYAVFRPSAGSWYQLRSSQGFFAVQFGLSTDKPTVGDYDGDGKTDVAVFREGNWYQQRSTQGFTAIFFGQSDDKPLPKAFIP